MLTSFSPSPTRARRAALALLLVAAALVADAEVQRAPAAAYPTANVEIDGHGWGHGRGMGQWGSLGYAVAGWTYPQILSHFYSNTSPGDIGNPQVTVILRSFDARETLVQQGRGHMTTNAAGGTFFALRARRTGTNTFAVDSASNCGGPWTEIRTGMQGPVVMQPQIRDDDHQEMLQVCEPDGEGRWLRGDIRAVERNNASQGTVNAVDMQGYLRGVVPRESPGSWGDVGGGAGMNALRAQAVAARSYAWAENQTVYARTCDTDACQVYGGRAVQNGAGFTNLEDARSNQAIFDTAGQVRILNGAVARTEFSSSTGGYTAGGTFPAVVDDGDAIASNPHHDWHESVPVSRIEAAYPGIGTLNNVRVIRRNGLGDYGGRALEVVVEGSSGNRTVSGNDFRFDAGIRSDWFRINAPSGPPPPPAPPPSNPWNGPYAFRPDGNVQSAPDPAAVRGSERVDVVVRGTDGFYWAFWNGSSWSNWAGLGSPPSGYEGDPTVVSWAPGRLDVFVKGANDSKLWQTFTYNGGATWSGWIKPVGDDGVLGSPPEVSSRGPGRLDLFVLGTDGTIYQRFYEGNWNDRWLTQGAPPTGAKGDPGTISPDGSRVEVFARGGDDKLWQRSWDGAQWGGWSQPVGNDGVLASSPDATSWAPGNLLVFIRGTDSGIYMVRFGDGRWSGWQRVGGQGAVTPNTPGATSRGNGRYDMFVRGTDNRAWQIWQ